MTTETKTEAREMCLTLGCPHPTDCKHRVPVVAESALSALRAEHQRTEEQAAALRNLVEKGKNYLTTAWSDLVDAALSSDTGRGWVSPEEHQRTQERLNAALRLLQQWERYATAPNGEGESMPAAPERARVLDGRDFERWVLASEHQRVVADAEWFKRQRDDALALVDMKERALAEVTKERDATRAEMSRWAQRHLDVVGERNEARAALAASEEKAREIRGVIEKMQDEVESWGHTEDCSRAGECDEAHAHDAEDREYYDCPEGEHRWCEDHGHDECPPCECGKAPMLEMIGNALAALSPAPRVGAESETNEKCGIRISGDEWCALPHPHEGPHRAKRPAPASEEPKR